MTDSAPDPADAFERHIGQYEANLRHIDSLLLRAKQGASGLPADSEFHAQLEKVAGDRDKVQAHLDQLKRMSSEAFAEKMIEQSGPMGIWDAVAEDLEKLVERLEKK